MRRETIVGAIEELQDILSSSKLEQYYVSPGSSSNPRLFKVMAEEMPAYAVASSKLSEAALQLADNFGFKNLFAMDLWSTVLLDQGGAKQQGDGPSRELIVAARDARIFLKFSEYIISLIGRASKSSAPKDGVTENPKGNATLTLLLSDDDDSLKLTELVKSAQDIERLYDSIVTIHKYPKSVLIVKSIDSGSEKSLDLVGVATAIAKLKDLLLESWDRIRFAKSQKINASLVTMSNGLSVLTDIEKAISSKSVSKEQGEKLKKDILKSVDSLFSNGAYISEMITVPMKVQQLLPSRQPAMLTYAPADSEAKTDPRKNKLKRFNKEKPGKDAEEERGDTETDHDNEDDFLNHIVRRRKPRA